jgi:hypothetical protein
VREDDRAGAGVGTSDGLVLVSGMWSVWDTSDGLPVGAGTMLGAQVGSPAGSGSNMGIRRLLAVVPVVVPGGRRGGVGAKIGACGGQVTFGLSGVARVGAKRIGPSFIH